MLPPTAIAFDLDGTLIDSRGDIVAAMNHALIRTGRAPLPGPVIVRFVGDGARALCARSAQLPEHSDEVSQLVDLFVDYYTDHPIDFTRWSPAAQETLEIFAEEMPDLVLGVCTNKPRPTTEAVLGALGIRTRFRGLVAGGDLPEKKPAPGPLLLLAKLLRVAPETVVMVGDGPQDVECARRAGMRSVAVDSGFSSRERLLAARPDVLLRSLSELPDVIRRWRDATARVSIATR
ncbi:Phosphoglycolate phosphatase [Minicystis rosea]|nr:Phosphoglycolate phosphatase [Minicystis rosea]